MKSVNTCLPSLYISRRAVAAFPLTSTDTNSYLVSTLGRFGFFFLPSSMLAIHSSIEVFEISPSL